MSVTKTTTTVTVNGGEHTLPKNQFESEYEFAVACGFSSGTNWRVYRKSVQPMEYLTEDARVDSPVEVQDGDMFSVVPEFIGDG